MDFHFVKTGNIYKHNFDFSITHSPDIWTISRSNDCPEFRGNGVDVRPLTMVQQKLFQNSPNPILVKFIGKTDSNYVFLVFGGTPLVTLCGLQRASCMIMYFHALGHFQVFAI